MRSPAELTQIFRSNGKKVTPQRQSIFRALEGNDGHPSAEMVYDAVRTEMETISLKTVYQTLNDLAELGEIAALDLGTGTVRFAGLELPADVAQGYDVGGAEVVFRGECPACRARVGAHGAAAPVADSGWAAP